VEKTRVSSKCGFLAMASVLLLAVCFSGCGAVSSSSTGTTTPPGIAIALSTAPPSTIAPSGTATIAATVTNDGANGGVDWSCAPAGNCGSFSPTHTASGATTTFTAPAAGGSVTITATSTSNHSVAATAPVSVSSPGTLTVSIAGAPGTLAPSATSTVSATVLNDTASAGVDWTCVPAGSCGTFSSAHTASTVTTTYTAPSTAGTVTITATSTSNHAVSASATITVAASTAAGGTLTSGSFAFAVSGEDSQKHTIAIIGSVALDASGKVTGGAQDYVSHDGATSPPSGDAITGGQLTMTSNGNGKGTLTLTTLNTAVGVGGIETFSIVVVNSKHALIVEFDGGATSSGTMDMQTSTAQISGPFSFTVSGRLGHTVIEAFGGNITANGAGGLSVKVDQNSGGTITKGGTNTGTYIAPDPATGRGTMAFGGNTLSYYVVNAKVLRLVVTNLGNPEAGSAYAGFGNPVPNAKFVFTDSSNLASGAVFSAAGFLSADGNGHVSGFADVDENGTHTSAPVTGTYTVDSHGYGSITITPGAQDVSVLGLYLTDPTINFSDPNSPADAGLFGLLLDLDSKIPGSGVLISLPASGVNSPTGNFALSMQTSNTDNQADAVGVVTISGTSLTGAEDLNDLFKMVSSTGLNAAISVSGTFVADTANPGRFTLPFAVVGTTPPTFNYVLYQASNTQIIVLEVDSPQYGLGTLQQQH
jgi:hypothetical protein